jgi:hypothetical protein
MIGDPSGYMIRRPLQERLSISGVVLPVGHERKTELTHNKCYRKGYR